MKTWKTIGITALMLASLCWSGTAQARRFDNHANQARYHNQGTCPQYANHNEPRWGGEQARERHWRDRGRHEGWERGRHEGWERGRHEGWERHRGWQREHNQFARSYRW